MSEVADVLTKAVKILDEKGWCQDTLENEQGNVCAFGAINTALQGQPVAGVMLMSEYHALTRRAAPVAEALNRHLPEDFSTFNIDSPRSRVVDYNNARTTTVEDIKDLFKKTIYDEESK